MAPLASFLIIAIIILYALWAVSFLLIWIGQLKIVKMIVQLERAVDYSLLKSDVYLAAASGNTEELKKRDENTKKNLEEIKEKIRKEFDVD